MLDFDNTQISEISEPELVEGTNRETTAQQTQISEISVISGKKVYRIANTD